MSTTGPATASGPGPQSLRAERLRVGVDACCWANGRGYGRFTRELLPRMAAQAPAWEFVCFLDAAAAAAFDVPAPNVRPVEVRLSAPPTQAAAADGYRSPADLLRLTRATGRERLDAFFSPSVYTYYPVPPRLPTLVCVHDAIAERYPELTLPSRRARLFWRAKVWLALKQAGLVLTVSDYAAGELETVLGIPAARIRVAGEAPAAAYRPSRRAEDRRAIGERYDLPARARWFTYVGGFNPHKHVDVLIRAHARLAREVESPPLLLLVGTVDRDVFHGAQGEIRAAIAAAGTERLVRWTGFVPDEDLRHLHGHALGLVLPSASEGFGLPAVEAAACGTPVIATTESPLPELLAGGGLFVAPGDEDALTEAMRHLLQDETARRAMGETALARAAALDWDRSARVALDALAEVAG